MYLRSLRKIFGKIFERIYPEILSEALINLVVVAFGKPDGQKKFLIGEIWRNCKNDLLQKDLIYDILLNNFMESEPFVCCV